MIAEAKLEADDRKIAKKAGWFVDKIMRTARNSFPDRFYARGGKDRCTLCGRGHIVLIEWKREGKVPGRLQLMRHEELRQAGVEVYVCDSVENARALRRD